MWYNYWRTFFPPVTEEAVITFEKEYRESNEEKEDVLRIYEEMEGDMDEILNNVMCSQVTDTDRFVKIIHEGIQMHKVPIFETFTDLYGDGSEHTTTKLSSSKSRSTLSTTTTTTNKSNQHHQPSRRGLLAAKRAQTAREQRAAEEAAEAEEMLAELRAEHKKNTKTSSSSNKHNTEPSLTELILARRDNRNRNFADMIASLESKYGNLEDDDEDENIPPRSRKTNNKKLLHDKPTELSSTTASLTTPARVSGNKRENKSVDMDTSSPPKGRRKQ